MHNIASLPFGWLLIASSADACAAHQSAALHEVKKIDGVNKNRSLKDKGSLSGNSCYVKNMLRMPGALHKQQKELALWKSKIMQKTTFQFQSLATLVAFTKTLNGRYSLHTGNLTVTTFADPVLIDLAYKNYQATTTEKVLSYAE